MSGSSDHTLKAWDLATGAPVETLAGHRDWVWAVAVTPDGTTSCWTARSAGLPEEALPECERSATEQEILEGALQAGADHAFRYFRRIEGLPADDSARDFVDSDQEAGDRELKVAGEAPAKMPS